MKTSSAVVWNMLRVLLQTFVFLGVGIIVARLLTPQEIGQVAIVAVFLGFSELVASVAVSSSVIQRKDLLPGHINMATLYSIVLGLGLTAAVYFSADAIADWFDSDVSLLVQALSPMIFFSTASSVQRGLLMRSMNFKLLTKLDITATFIGHGLVTVTMAYMGYGVWSMASGMLVWSILNFLLLWFAAPVRLYRPESLEYFRDLWSFSLGVSLNNLIGFLTQRTIPMIVGKSLGVDMLGQYSKAVQTCAIPFTKIAMTISGVMFASYSGIQGDIEALRRRYLKSVRLVSATSIPVLFGMWVSAEYVILGLYGDQWETAVDVFRVLCIGAMFNNVLHLSGAIVQATGNIYREVKRQALVYLYLITLCFFVVDYGVISIAWLGVSGAVLLYFLMTSLTNSLLGIKWREFILAQLPGFVLGVPLASAGFLLIEVLYFFSIAGNKELSLMVLIAGQGLIYLALIVFIPDKYIGNIKRWVYETYSHKIPKTIEIRLKRLISPSEY
ncbi:MAG: lipopolysaccharide biosynthesis protein [Pontibacterium sp.]